jgi:hypothetical protein
VDKQDEGRQRLENQAIAIELTKLVVAESRPPVVADYFQLATDYLSVYRYLLNDLQQQANEIGHPFTARNY